MGTFNAVQRDLIHRHPTPQLSPLDEEGTKQMVYTYEYITRYISCSVPRLPTLDIFFLYLKRRFLVPFGLFIQYCFNVHNTMNTLKKLKYDFRKLFIKGTWQ
jgi:hypothetical protein